jgi:hypothetical protein
VIVQGDGGSRTAKKLAGALVVLLLGGILLVVLFVGGRLWWVSLRGPEALTPTSAATGSLHLAWDASPDQRVIGYEIRFGIQPGDYPWSEKVGNQTTATLTGLEIGTKYYIVAVAVDARGNKSDPSNEIEVVVGR